MRTTLCPRQNSHTCVDTLALPAAGAQINVPQLLRGEANSAPPPPSSDQSACHPTGCQAHPYL